MFAVEIQVSILTKSKKIKIKQHHQRRFFLCCLKSNQNPSDKNHYLRKLSKHRRKSIGIWKHFLKFH